MLGMFELTMVMCEKCKRGWSLDKAISDSIKADKSILDTTTKCVNCNHTFTYLEGIINEMLSENIFSSFGFISDIIDGGQCEIVVGKDNRFKFSKRIPSVNQMNVTCNSGFARVKAIELNENEFTILSTEVPGGVKAGESLIVSWSVNGRSGWGNVPVWKRYLIQAKEELIDDKYNLCLLTSEMAFESFIDSTLKKILVHKGINDEASYTIVESINSIYDKVHKLLRDLDNIVFKDYKPINRMWMELVKKRNKVGHGEVAEISKIEAMEAFEIVVKGIIYISMKSSIDLEIHL